MVHVDKITPAGVVGVLHGLSKRAHAARNCGKGHAYPFVDECPRPHPRDAQREEAQLNACAGRTGTYGDLEAASFGATEYGR